MSKRNVVITGVSRGIGAEIARCSTADGFQVLGIDLEKPTGWSGPFLACDLSRPDCGSLAAREASRVGMNEIHGLVNNAGVMIHSSSTEMDVAEWDRLMAVNLRAPFLLSRALFSLLEKGKGSVVNIGSVHAQATTAEVAAYAASKGGLMALTRALAVEWGGRGVRVNAVLPGAIDTQMLASGMRAQLEQRTPLRRIGSVAEVADAVSFLLSDRASFATGSLFAVDGGALSRLSTE